MLKIIYFTIRQEFARCAMHRNPSLHTVAAFGKANNNLYRAKYPNRIQGAW
jgi:hypothetical protein